MKKRILLIIWIVCLVVPKLYAQEGLNVGRLFDGRYQSDPNAIEVLVKGKKLEPYQLTLFRSLTVKNAPQAFEQIEKWVKQDGAQAIDKETGLIGGKLYYGFYRFPPKDRVYRYLFFRNSSLRKVEANEVTVVYMEGYSTLEELKKMFK